MTTHYKGIFIYSDTLYIKNNQTGVGKQPLMDVESALVYIEDLGVVGNMENAADGLR